MKKIEAIIKPSGLEEVRRALAELGVEDFTVSEVQGFGPANRHTEIFRGQRYSVESQAKVKLEMVVSDEDLNAAVEAVMVGANAGQGDERKVAVFAVQDAFASGGVALAH